jgi:hypothetical protein
MINTKANNADVYNKTDIDTMITTKANTSHTHAISEITGL